MVEGAEHFPRLLEEVERVVERAGERDENLRTICQMLKESIPYYDWVGFYLADPAETELTLGPFAGEPTEHVKIPFGRGICGQAVEKRETVVVDDVSAETNYLSCSPRVKSEIVVPIFKDERIVGELDIDSHTPSAFSEVDRAFVEKVGQAVARLF